MDEFQPNLLAIIVIVSGLALVPFFVVTMTAFMKIAVVMFLVRNALGIQQTPPNIVLYGIAIVLTLYTASPLMGEIYSQLGDSKQTYDTIEDWQHAGALVREPIQNHLVRFTEPNEREFFLKATSKIWPEEARENVKSDDLLILLPSFVISELTRAFEIGFLLYLPFIVIDLIVSNILLAMGMIMVSPMVISVPFKLFLFVVIDGWSKLMHGLVLSYG